MDESYTLRYFCAHLPGKTVVFLGSSGVEVFSESAAFPIALTKATPAVGSAPR